MFYHFFSLSDHPLLFQFQNIATLISEHSLVKSSVAHIQLLASKKTNETRPHQVQRHCSKYIFSVLISVLIASRENLVFSQDSINNDSVKGYMYFNKTHNF